jgi:hypothetical protein
MNNFEGKYIKIASKYLDDKMKALNVKGKGVSQLEEKKESTFGRIISGMFKS